MNSSILTLSVRFEQDVVAARQRARQIAAWLGLDVQHQTRLATAVSEIARNAYTYAGGGKAEFSVEGQTTPQWLQVRISDEGPGIRDVGCILEGRYKSRTGMGLGIIGANRLMDHFQIESAPGEGTAVTLKMRVPRKSTPITAQSLTRLRDELSGEQPQSAFDEVRQQNAELLSILEELRRRQQDLERLNHELEDTNRGVVALYAELDEKAGHLRRADEVKTRFLSNMSHEFRTPLNSILALSRLLLDRTDGDLTGEQERQLVFIRKSAESLYELVNDLLDLAKVEAGKITVRASEFEVKNLFGALRGMLRPLLLTSSVTLVFEDPESMPPLLTDEAKVSQILRNFVSNALKFTEAGEVRVAAGTDGENAIFTVADTGIGIAEEDRENIFQEFTQLDSPIQRKVKGTGLGLPLSRKLAQLLGGSVSVTSQCGVGSVFSAIIPMVYAPSGAVLQVEAAVEIDKSRVPILVIEDQYETRLIYEKFLKGSAFQVLPARSITEARVVMRNVRPRALLLDVLLESQDGWDFLAAFKSNPETKDIPVIVASVVEDRQKGLALGADVYAIKPIERKWLLDSLTRLTRQSKSRRILIVDDEEASRYLLKQLFAGIHHEFLEAADGVEGLQLARDRQPDVILLDLIMPRLSGFEMLEKLRSDPSTREIPVVVATSKVLSNSERQQLAGHRTPVILKARLSSDKVKDATRDILAEAGLDDLLSPADKSTVEAG